MIAGEIILEKIRNKGWNAYSRKLGEEADVTVDRGPASLLNEGTSYVLLPKTDTPSDSASVLERLEEAARKTNGKLPTIRIGAVAYPLTGFTFLPRGVKLHTPYAGREEDDQIVVAHKDFIKSLETMLQM